MSFKLEVESYDVTASDNFITVTNVAEENRVELPKFMKLIICPLIASNKVNKQFFRNTIKTIFNFADEPGLTVVRKIIRTIDRKEVSSTRLLGTFVIAAIARAALTSFLLATSVVWGLPFGAGCLFAQILDQRSQNKVILEDAGNEKIYFNDDDDWGY